MVQTASPLIFSLSGKLLFKLGLAVVLASGLLLTWVLHLHLGSMRKIPGPWHLKLSTAWVKYHELVGSKSVWVHSLHLRYGSVVQVGRNEISFASYTASKQIYNTGNKDFSKTELYHLFEQDGQM